MPGDPLWINVNAGAPSYTANELRQAMALAVMYDGRNMGARKGVRPGGNQLQVSYAAPTITVQPGLCLLDPGLSTPQGPYWVAIPAAETHTLTAADATNPRKDIVIARVYDHDEDASGLRLARSEYLVGTPNPAPSEPAVPASAIKLALIDVPASPGAPVVTDRRVWTVAAGGILPVPNSTVRDALSAYAGQVAYQADIKTLMIYDGSAWTTRFGYVDETIRTSPVGPFTTTETVIQSSTFTAISGIRYKVSAVQELHSTVSGDQVQLRLRWKAGASVDTSGTQFHSIITTCYTANLGAEEVLIRTIPGLSGQVTVGVTAVRFGGSGSITMHADASQNQTLLVEAV